jgi:signal transduction histidine kinase
LVFICALALWFWWKTRIANEYITRLRKNEQQELQAIISSRDSEIIILRKENETFSKIIHKDNKLIPAMELAVKEALYDVAHNDSQAERIQKTEELLSQLEVFSSERAGIVKTYEHADAGLPRTGILPIDALFSFMLQKASRKDVSLELRFDKTVNELIPAVISREDASTLLADLLENAIIASSENDQCKSVLAEFVRRDTYPCICVSDTGAAFSAEVLQNWGKRRITTHTESGGSGIGLMTIYEICKRYHASFLVNYLEAGATYTKCVSVCFDGVERFHIGTTPT